MIHRSATGNLPVYQEIRAGGSKKQTRIRRIEGDAKVLRDELTEELGIKKEECVWHQLTNNIVLKGHRRLELMEVLKAKGF
jgi:large subunit ribosomal protein L49